MMFNDKSPMTDQILMWMKELGYSKHAIDFAKKKIKDEKDLDYALGLANTLAMVLIGKSLFKGINESKIDLPKEIQSNESD